MVAMVLCSRARDHPKTLDDVEFDKVDPAHLLAALEREGGKLEAERHRFRERRERRLVERLPDCAQLFVGQHARARRFFERRLEAGGGILNGHVQLVAREAIEANDDRGDAVRCDALPAFPDVVDQLAYLRPRDRVDRQGAELGQNVRLDALAIDRHGRGPVARLGGFQIGVREILQGAHFL
jgi:hypothetical protein